MHIGGSPSFPPGKDGEAEEFNVAQYQRQHLCFDRLVVQSISVTAVVLDFAI